jgi:hypothetical protein
MNKKKDIVAGAFKISAFDLRYINMPRLSIIEYIAAWYRRSKKNMRNYNES